ncbi:MAG: FAD-binding protein [Flavobacteriales bacterium]|nr:FAD-binding protein [Flavobacteriales bacterium]
MSAQGRSSKSKFKRRKEASKPQRILSPIGEVEVRLPVEAAHQSESFRTAVAAAAGWTPEELGDYRVIRKNLDARHRPVQAMWLTQIAQVGHVLPKDNFVALKLPALDADAPEIVIIGAGPAGLFAAIEAIQSGFRPVIIERGAPVRQRRRDLVKITRDHRVDPHSNYCFGEGGAGTYSDGKLYTRSHKRGDIRGALECLVSFGADPNILVESHPHIGTNKLPGIIESMRESIITSGGVVHFGCLLVDIQTDGPEGAVSAVIWKEVDSQEQVTYSCQSVILATGHSARDVFHLLHGKGWKLEAKPFAIGVRIEHPQSVIDQAQYHGEPRGDWLPPASYKLVCQARGRGVHSFCMCPGGIIAPCATQDGEVVTNGWSPSKRNNPFANSGMVVQIDESIWEAEGFSGPLGGLEFQQMIEKRCWEAAGKTQRAPAQRLHDFLEGDKESKDLPTCSYLPGIVSVNLRSLLPESIAEPLAEGLATFGKKMPAFMHADAVLVAPESRTSSPIRIPRDNDSLQHPDVPGLFPCGEGGGYAGGILSAALDGTKVVQASVRRFQDRA